MIDLTQIGVLLEHIIALVPLGILGLIRWGMWLAKRIPALFYRPIENNFDIDATIITPVYQIEPILFRKAIESWIANKPEKIIAVIDITDKTCAAIAREYPQIDVVITDIPGKRPALMTGIELATTPIVVLVDADVIWEPKVLSKVKMPFANPEIGGVATAQVMYPTNHVKATVWERINDFYLDARYTAELPANSLIGKAVSCLSGRTAAYRTEILKSVREPFLNEIFWGRKCLSGEDKRFTCLMLQMGYRTWYQLDAVVHSTFNPDFRGFVKQRVRWARNSFRSDIKALVQGWVWRYPYLALTLIDKTVAPFTLLVSPIALLVAASLGHWRIALAIIIWWLFSRAVKYWPHLRRCPQDWVLLPLFIVMQFFMSLVKAYALITFNKHEWGTKRMRMVNNQAVRS